MKAGSVFIKTLGCKVNSYDSAMLEKEFEKNGYQVLNNSDKADLLVINSFLSSVFITNYSTDCNCVSSM